LEDSTIVTILATIIVGFSIAFFVRFGIKPKIETVYEENRNARLRGLLISVNTASSRFDDMYAIFESQENFVADEEMAYNLTINQVETLRMISRDAKRDFDDIRDKIDFLLFHHTFDELETILNYLANAFSFFTIPEGVEPDTRGPIHVFYFPIRVAVMRHHGWRLINMFPHEINYDFIQRMRKYDLLRALV